MNLHVAMKVGLYHHLQLTDVRRVVSEGSHALRWRGQEIWPPRKIFRRLSRKELKGEIVARTLRRRSFQHPNSEASLSGECFHG